jgi:DNA-binding SARP family transcriptional activator/tetratricopeptide (TPR) repeat protein
VDGVDRVVEFRLLGPVGIWQGAHRLGLSAAQQRTVLAMLLLDCGRAVSVDRLVAALWGAAPPAAARNAVQGCVSQIRRTLATTGLSGAGTGLITARQGYCLVVDQTTVDLHNFRTLVRAVDERDPANARDMLRRGLDLWRGAAMADAAGSWLLEVVAPQLEEERLAALEQHATLGLLLGRHREVVDELSALVTEFPLRESLVVTLMTALHRCGRRADALALFRRVRQRFVDELGIDPGEKLQRAHQSVLNGQEPTPAQATPAATVVTTWKPVRQMPTTTPRFVGRRAEMDDLDAGDGSGIWVISGTAGVGKTTLAVHWAQRVRDRFPDGQLYVNLRGFDPVGQPTSPAEALPVLLEMLQVPAERIPNTLRAQIGLYRDILAARQMLIVLDNVRDADQVRPMLPGLSGCVILITSRNQLTSLVAIEGAHPLPLDLLSTDEARELLVRRLGAGRVAAEPGAVNDIITRCARLPLALAILAARAATHPGFALAALSSEPDQPRAGLDAFDGGDHATQVRAVFSWSYETLTPDAARLFRLLGLHPGPDIATPAAASLAGTSPGQARPLLAELARAHLVTEHAPGRYSFHDLLRAYATELAHIHDRATERRAAVNRVLDHHLHTAHAAHRMLNPHRDPITLSPPQPGVAAEHFTDHVQALAWFIAEHAVLVAAIAHASKAGFEAHAWQLAWTLTEYFSRRGHWHDWAATHRDALDAARRQTDRPGLAHTHRGLAIAHAYLGQHDDAYAHFNHALRLFAELEDHTSQGHTHLGIGWMLARQHRHLEALDHANQAIDFYRATGDQAGQANALNAAGWYQAQLGDYRQTLVSCGQALPLLRDFGDHRGMASTWDSLGYAYHHLGHHEQATACCQQAVDLYRKIGDRFNEADTLTHLGDTHHAIGNHHTAQDTWQQALIILDELGHPDADQVRAKLNLTSGVR